MHIRTQRALAVGVSAMDFPSDWDDDMIEFHLNESSWCCSNLISELEKYDEKNGCICSICEAKVIEEIFGQ